MKQGSICDELDDIARSYDYGIVPGSATVFVKDELNNFGKLDLTLLEGVMIVIEASGEGFKVTSCTPVTNVGRAFLTAQTIQNNLEVPFETMDNLLMAISPMFSQRFQKALYEKLESVHRLNESNSHDAMLTTEPINTATIPISTCTDSLSSGSSTTTCTPNSNSMINATNTATINLLPSHSLLKENASATLASPNSQPATNTAESINLDQVLTQDVLDDIHQWLH